ncbi:MAG: hypothetical protein EBU28_11000, partial [Gammaproteobacteria bacterium]|nr:hypothetical protein [Gammaproteobacteria bacterium]
MKKLILKNLLRVGALVALTVPLSGCSEFWCWPFDCSSSDSSAGVEGSANPTPAQNTPVANDTAPTTPGGPQEFNLNKAV